MRAIIFPGKYIQGSGALAEAGRYIAMYGKKPVLVWDERTKAAVKDSLMQSLDKAGLEIIEAMFGGECTHKEAERITEISKAKGGNVIVGIGGGKAIDTAKAVAAYQSLPTIVIPTISSNDSPPSACTVWYDDAGENVGGDLWVRSPDVVLVDSRVIVNAPVRSLVAGIGDGLATWMEANASYVARKGTCAGGLHTMAALTLAKLCFDTLIEYGIEAVRSVENKLITPAVEKVIEANSLLSGIGWESAGVASAHAIANSFGYFHETHERMHGEKVAFGLLTQLCLEEDISVSEIYRIADFMIEIGLPVTLEEFNLKDVSDERLLEYTKMITAEGSPHGNVHNHNFKVTAVSLRDAMRAADSLGRRRKVACGKA